MQGDKQIAKGDRWELLRTEYDGVVIESPIYQSLPRGIIRQPIPAAAIEALVAEQAAIDNQVETILEAGDEHVHNPE